ncbi:MULTISPECIES: heavy metal translocating P-type ATPase [Nocardiaceae]|uniref:heavy metal translocating P-type ATPase n=1 Tax=Nocardiaceae TaxID=85025 RepID=UPI0009B8B6F6|nr:MULTISPECIES: heavy metal translocating P-type ATPase [Rhodococcus]MBJ7324268.1 heavy metal translocating P-type ATPase [Rhodococcus sp. (in: high G+C Gram-positive bacteria)]WQH28015.1 heavy metal translocating P-type ATPase [Rhodococcus fascians]
MASIGTTTAPGAPTARSNPGYARTRLLDVSEVRWALAATALFLLGLTAQLLGAPTWLFWALYLACYVTGGWEPALEGLRALREKTLDVDLLMIVAALGAAAIGQIFDGALLIVIFATSGALEAVLTRRTADSIRSLLDLAPETAMILDAAGIEERVDAADLRRGDIVIVRPGERISGEGSIVEGSSDVDQSSITGEAIPVFKSVGDDVFAGTINGTGALRIRIDVDPSETVIARIVAMVEHASATKAKKQLFIEKVEQYYSKTVVVSTAAIFAIPMLLGSELQPALLRAMTFMIVASPCAVVLATMPPLLAAMATAGRHGVLVKSAVVMEQLRTIEVVAFDKTGTLTEGTPQVEHIDAVDGSSESDVLAVAAAAEMSSEHPIGTAIVDHARSRELSIPEATAFESTPGVGVRASVDGEVVTVSKPDLTPKTDPSEPLSAHECEAVAERTAAERESGGMTAVIVRAGGRPIGVIALADTVRSNLAATISELERVTGSPSVLLTGDNSRAAHAVAGRIGITDVRAGLLPEDKAGAVTELQRSGLSDGGTRERRVLLVGDGVNDAPALAAADIGVAMGRKGSDLALDTADAVLVRDDLATLSSVIELSRRAHRIVVANLAIASTFIVVLVAWDLIWTLPLPIGVAGHESSTVLVALNGMRLLSSRVWRRRT